MRFRYLLSDQHGDIELCAEDLEQPLLISPSEKHPFLTLADYFGALQKFIMPDDGTILHSALKKQHTLADITEIIIRSEKHGAFYHIASVEIVGPGENSKFVVTTALSESARTSLDEEFFILQQLAEINSEFIPKNYGKESVKWETDSGSEEFLMVLGEWLDGYHEWHASADPESGNRKIHLWDYTNGYRFLTDAESYELLRQVAYVLTFYYDQSSFCQIYPWHHGAGDFVAKAENSGAISVKLITARQYEPLVQLDQAEEADRLVATIHFLLNLTLRIRLDRLDGVGEPAWLDEFSVDAAVAGFFAGLAATQVEDRLLIGPVAEFLEIMQSFDTREIFDMYESLLEIYVEEDQDDFRLIQAELADHAAELHEALQSFSLGKP
jgi:sulfur relay (sulfurtransferase) DsrF/TusC family protein